MHGSMRIDVLFDFDLANLDEDIDVDDSNDRIIGARDPAIEIHPYQVNVKVLNLHKCGGSVLLNKPLRYSIMAGSAIRSFLQHPKYENPHTNDMALLHWNQPFMLFAFHHKALLCHSGQNAKTLPGGERHQKVLALHSPTI